MPPTPSPNLRPCRALAADVETFLLGDDSEQRRCCFAVPLVSGADQPVGTTASVCLAPTANITAQFEADPVTQAADYTIPSCGYEDPLGEYGTAGADALTGWPVGMQTKLCLEVGSIFPSRDGATCMCLLVTSAGVCTTQGSSPPDSPPTRVCLPGQLRNATARRPMLLIRMRRGRTH